jgi:hypothetical protein
MNPCSFAPIPHKTGFLENSQMTRYFVLRCLQGPHELADTQFSFHEEAQQPKAQWVVKGPMKRSDVGN